MPAAKISLDIDTRKLIGATGSTLQGFSGKKGSVLDFQLAITQATIPLSLPPGTTVQVAMKRVADPAGAYLLHVSANPTGWGTGSRWFFRLDLSAPAFSTVLGLPVDFEILISLPDGQRILSLPIAFTVLKNVMT
jgi:hypothetical protein